MDEQLLSVISRLKTTGDGMEFIEYLERLARENYLAFVKDHSQANDIHKGYALAIESLLTVFRDCDASLALLEKTKDIEKENTELSPHY